MEAKPLGNRDTTSLLKNQRFRRLLAAQFCAVTVIYSLTLAGATLVEEQTHSSAQTGLVIVSSILPAFLGSLVAGAVVDRWGRTWVLMGSHLVRALFALAFWLATRLLPLGPTLAIVYAVNVAGATFTQFAMTAELALLPDLVVHSHLTSANGLLQLSMLAAEGLGIVLLSPLLIKVAGVPAMGLVGVGLYLVSFTLVATLPKYQPTISQAADQESVWKDLQAGWRTIAGDRLLSMVAIQATLAAMLLLVLLSLVPGLLSRHLGLGVEDAPFILLPGGLGFALGALLVGRWDPRLPRPVWIALGLIGLGGAIGLVSLFSAWGGQLWIIVPLILGVGLALAFVIIPARTVLQDRPPAELRGRVIAAQLALANAAAVVPLLLGGTLADQLGIQPVMGALGLVAMGAGAIGLHFARS